MRSHMTKILHRVVCLPLIGMSGRLPTLERMPVRGDKTRLASECAGQPQSGPGAIQFGRHSGNLMTGRLGAVRATSTNPAAENMATVPVKIAAPPTRAALRAATSTG